jgi:hypothetical protein
LVDGSLVVEEALDADGRGAEGLVQSLERAPEGCVRSDVLSVKTRLTWLIMGL